MIQRTMKYDVPGAGVPAPERRKRMRKKIYSVLLAAAMIISLAACGKKPAASTEASTEPPQTEPKIIRVSSENCRTFDPYEANSSEDAFNTWCQARLYRSWTKIEGSTDTRYMRPELAAAEPEQKDAEGRVWHVRIRDNACFSDGTPITAASFEASMKICLDPLMKHRSGDNMNLYISILNARTYYTGGDVKWEDVGIKAIDGNVLEITTEAPVTADLVMKAFGEYGTVPVDPDLYASCMSADGSSSTYGTSADKAKYCGPFTVTKWVKESRIVMEKNPNYVFADEILLDGAELVYVQNVQTRVEMFERGELDAVTITAQVGEQYMDSPDYFSTPSRYLLMIEINDNTAHYAAAPDGKSEPIRVEHRPDDPNNIDVYTEKDGSRTYTARALDASKMSLPILSDPDFKNALWYTVDRVTLARREGGEPANFIVPYTSYCGEYNPVRFRDTDEAKAYVEDINKSFDPVLAKQYFDRAMARAGLGKLELTLTISSDNDEMSICAQFLQEEFARIFEGRLSLKIEAVPSANRLAKMKAWRTDENAFELGLSNWSRTVTDASPMNQFDVFSSSYWSKCNAAYHCETLEKTIWLQESDASYKTDMAKNVAAAAAMEKAALEERIVIPLFERTQQSLLHEWVTYDFNDPANVRYWLCGIDTGLKK